PEPPVNHQFHLAMAKWTTATINSGQDADPLEYPAPVPRPGPPQPEETLSSAPDRGGLRAAPVAAELARFLG
ncbi:hypothetical protein ABZ726_26445, partial [Streptomyces hundungensis]